MTLQSRPRSGPGAGKTLRAIDELIDAGLAQPAQADRLAGVAQRYAVAISPAMQALIDPADADDPIARQFVPDERELRHLPEERADPIGDHAHSPVKGIVHRYPDRVLLKPLHTCPVYCRFCFRREMVGPSAEALNAAELAAALDYIRARPEIFEVILTGGDPLMLSARRLQEIVATLDAIPHVGVIRLHSRVPVADPARVTDLAVAALKPKRAAGFIAIHCNHPRELTPEMRAACARLADAGLPLLGQTVLLKGVNDQVEILAELFRSMLRARIKPYYLHQADPAPGTSHFRVDLARGRELVRALRGILTGIGQPLYVIDIPGGYGKAPAAPGFVEEAPDGTFTAHDWRGGGHRYRG